VETRKKNTPTAGGGGGGGAAAIAAAAYPLPSVKKACCPEDKSVALKRACCGDERVWPWKGPVVEGRECSPEKGLLWR